MIVDYSGLRKLLTNVFVILRTQVLHILFISQSVLSFSQRLLWKRGDSFYQQLFDSLVRLCNMILHCTVGSSMCRKYQELSAIPR